MLSAKSRPYIEASVPVLREHGGAITQAFYRNLFVEFPALTNLFNMGNQANGSQQQSLASAVFAYAANFDNADALAPVVSRIVHKHVSVGITEAQYPIVGRHLLAAIQEVLGDAATPELLAAWAEAYGILADVLIAAEKRLYAERGTAPGEFREMRVVEVTPQSELVTSYTLAPVDGLPVGEFHAGQYISVAVDFADGSRQIRQYSLSDAHAANRLRISVKREPAGAETPAGQVSNWLHDHLQVESVIRITPPSGDFTPAAGDGPLVLLSAGVGITPMISALNQIARVDPERSVLFAHATRNEHHHAHKADVAAAQAAMPNLKVVTFYEQAEGADLAEGLRAGLLDLQALPTWSKSEATVHLCGPIGFMRAQKAALNAAGVPDSRIHREVFGPEMLDQLA